MSGCYNEKIPGISGIDTRALTKKLRTGGVMMAALVVSDSEIDVEHVKQQLSSATHYDSEQFMDEVSTKQEKEYMEMIVNPLLLLILEQKMLFFEMFENLAIRQFYFHGIPRMKK